MEENIYSLLDKLKLNEIEIKNFKNASFIETPLFLRSENTLLLKIAMDDILDYQVYDIFLNKLKRLLKCKVKVEFAITNLSNNVLEINHYVRRIVQTNNDLRVYMNTYPLMEDNKLVYQFSKNDDLNKAKEIVDLFKVELRSYGINNEIIIKKLDNSEEIIEEVKVVSAPKVLEPIKKEYKAGPRTKIDNYPLFGIKDLSDGISEVKIVGKIFEIEERTTRNNKLSQTLYVADHDDAICINRFESKYLSQEEMHSLHIGDYISAYGGVEYNTYRRENMFNAKRIDLYNYVPKVDKAQEKRVELHVHTKLSEMDGVSEIKDYIKQADKWGHKAIAISDHSVVQAFPAAQKCAKAINEGREEEFKMIYGVELYMIDPNLKPVTNPTDQKLSDARYCVFDLEATGLSSKYDEIIEFGGVIVEDGMIKEKMQTFIKPKKPISAHITSITNINNDDVANAPEIEEALDKILAFSSGCVMVAHNAEYDMNMLNASLERCGKERITSTYIDTLDLAKYLITDRKYFNLGSVARYYKVKYDGDVAHRADYDAKVLSEVMLHLLKDLKGIDTFNDLSKCNTTKSLSSYFTKHISVLAKNDQGIKDIYELVTLSHTEYLCEIQKSNNKSICVPRIPREIVKKYQDRGNIIIGSCCLNGDVFDMARTREDHILEETMKFYDYIEVQPPENYMHLVRSGNINDLERLHNILKSIISIGKKLGKTVVATGDAHYCEEEKKIVRDIYINAKAIGGIMHPLYHRNFDDRINNPSPAQHFRTTTEMLNEFKFLDDDLAYEIVVTNTNKIADSLDYIYPVKNQLYPPEIEGAREKLTNICYDKAHSLYGDPLPEIVEARLKKELDSIIGNGYEVVYYISHLLVKQSNDDGYLVGSRGSVGSSFVATMAGITEVNPLRPHYYCPKCHYSNFDLDEKYQSGFDLPIASCPHCGSEMVGEGQNIPFETFLGFEGDKIPDIDLNFSGEYQGNAHRYIQKVFGEKNAFRAGTIGTVADKTAFGYVKGYQEEMGIEGKLSNAQVLHLAKEAAGVRRTTSQHPGGIVVFPESIDVSDVTPVQYPANDPTEDMRTTHLDYHEIEQNVLKFDILGHVDPTAMKMLEEISGVDVTKIPMNDKETMSIFSSVDALKIDTTKNTEKTGAAGLPEFGTTFVRGILEDTKPTTFDELLKISGLSHGTDVWLNNAKDLVEKNIVTLKECIGCRDDIMVYLMQKGMQPKLAFTIMESVRKGRGLKPDWIDAMKANNVEDYYIESCKKIKYMFPKAHAAAYVIMALRIAWFKVHMPLHYYCQFFSIRCDAYDIETMINGEASIRAKMSEIQQKMNNPETKRDVTKKEKDIFSCLELSLEMVLRGYKFGKIDLNKSQATRFSIDPDNENTILPSFTSIDGLGDNVAISIVEARKKAPFLSKEDLQDRTGLSSTLIGKLASLHALDDLQDENQMSLFDSL